LIKHPDILSGLFILVLGAIAFILGQAIEIHPTPSLSARFFPMLCGAGLVAMGGGIIYQGIRGAPAPLPFLFDARVGATIAAFLIYFMTFAIVDFRVGAWAMMLVGMVILGARNRMQLLFVPIGVSAATYLMFRYGFKILLPTWI
jgi:putative tricarboxylic transport membrane protein